LLVYYHIDELSRDTIVASALREELKKVGCKLIYGNRATTRRLRHFNIFDVVILPGIDYYMIAYPDPNHLPDNIVILPTEAMTGGRTLKRMNNKYFGNDHQACEQWSKTIAMYLLWGFDHLKSFQENYPAYLDKCKVVGHPRLADSCLAPVRSKSNSKVVIGFVTRFSMINPFDQRSFFVSIYEAMKAKGKPDPVWFTNSENHDAEDIAYTESLDIRVFFYLMRSLDPEKYVLSIRVHPRENKERWLAFIRKYDLNVLLSKWDDPFSVWSRSVDIIVSPPSTSFYDLLYCGINPICIRNVVPARESHIVTESDDNNPILDYVYLPKSTDEILETINNGKVPDLSEGVDKILEGQAGISVAKNSISNIVTAIRSLPKSKSSAVVRSRCLLPFVIFAVVLVSYFKRWHNILLHGGEQSCGFTFTLSRLKMINGLAKAIKKKTPS
jgi:hypothetical protein